MPPLIFICYAGPDGPIAKGVHRALDARGMHPWCDAVDLVPGERWDEAIPRALKHAAAVLVLVTDRWPRVGDPGTGWYGPEEVAIAIDHTRRMDPRMLIVPTRLDGVSSDRLPYGLRRLVEIEATATDPDPIVAGLTRALERRARALTSPEVPALNQRLVDAERRIRTLEAQGAARAQIEAAIIEKIAIKRSLRAGGQLEAGDELDRYVLAERLGHGGFASVWRAWDPVRAEHIAIKVLHGRWNRDATKIDRFRRGVAQMARLKHPGVVPVLDIQREDNGWHFFVMAWMPGGDLFRAITRANAPLSADEGLRAVLEVADALAVAHARGVVHRDVKPQNILLDADGRAKLSDFDLVRALDTTGDTKTGAMGTFLYAAPEQLDRPQDVGPRADVYGLGMTAVFALTGRQPATMTKWQPGAVVARLPANATVRECLLRAIALDESTRPADAAVFAAELRAAMSVCLEPQEECAHRPAMVPITPGAFTMGSPAGEVGRFDSERAHQVKLTRGFLMAETAVTQAQWAALMGTNPAYFQGGSGDGDRPVERVSWFDAVKYCNALSAAEGLAPAYVIAGDEVTWDREAEGYRLPTEAEWEYAARAGTSTATYAGDLDIRGENDAPLLDDIAWYGGNSGSAHPKAVGSSGWPNTQHTHARASTQPVKGKRPNTWGLYDMLGNVWEWTWDRYAEYLAPSAAPPADPAGPAGGVNRVFRGGSFGSGARAARAASRRRWLPGLRVRGVGLRPVRTPRALGR